MFVPSQDCVFVCVDDQRSRMRVQDYAPRTLKYKHIFMEHTDSTIYGNAKMISEFIPFIFIK